MIKELNQDQIKIKTKIENEKEEESKTGIILLTHMKITVSPRYTSSFSFSFPNNSKYLTSLIKKFRDDLQKPSKGSPF